MASAMVASARLNVDLAKVRFREVGTTGTHPGTGESLR